MATSLTPADLKQLARVGAAARIKELEREIASLRRAFPGLGPKPSAGAAAESATATVAKNRRGRKAPMSAEEKKEVSARMRRYWAQRRAAKAPVAPAKPRPKPKGKGKARTSAQSKAQPPVESQS